MIDGYIEAIILGSKLAVSLASGLLTLGGIIYGGKGVINISNETYKILKEKLETEKLAKQN